MDSWIISEKTINCNKFQKFESISCLGNGYIGIRNSLEEDYLLSHRNTFINGVFNAPLGEVSELASLPDVTNFEIFIDGERFDMLTADVTEYERSLNMKNGEAVRKLVWKKNEKSVKIEFHRFVSYTQKHIVAQKVIIEPMNDVALKIKSGIDGKITNTGVQHFGPTELRSYPDGTVSLYAKTLQSGVGVSVKSMLHCDMDNKYFVTTDRRSVFSCMELSVRANARVEFEKLSSYASSRDIEYAEDSDAIVDSGAYLDEAQKKGYDLLLEETQADWHNFWDKNNIIIKSDNEFYQKAINFALYHLRIMANTEDNRLGIGAKALSGEGYKGHSFWDTEIFILSYYIYNNPKAARNLLEYRYKLLQVSREKAKKYGYEGAMYPWEGAWIEDGENCPYLGDMDLETGERRPNMMGEIEVHIGADITYAIYQYHAVTGDDDFMNKYGNEMVLSIAEFWLSRMEMRNGRYEICNVIGPDEYKENIDNNAYTNYMAHFNLSFAQNILKSLSETEIRNLSKKLNVEKLVADIPKAICLLYLPQADEDGIIPQFDGFRELKDVDILQYKKQEKVCTIFEDYSFEEIKKMRVCKQADIVMLFYTLRKCFEEQTIMKNFRYYEECTLHDSSLSACIHSLVASRIGMTDMANKLFYDCCCVDLGDKNNNSDNGIHAASIGGIWLAVVMGFGGVSISDGKLSIEPVLPQGIEEYSFPIEYAGTRILVTVNRNSVDIVKTSGESIEVFVNNKNKKVL